jgi:hypothetical protein
MPTILVLDDDHGFRSALAETLRDDGNAVRDYGAPSPSPPRENAPQAAFSFVRTDDRPLKPRRSDTPWHSDCVRLGP